MRLLLVVLTVACIIFLCRAVIAYSLRKYSGLVEDAYLDFLELAKKYGYNPREYDITTEDGYILKLHRIPGNKEKPVLITHGFLDSSYSFILRGQRSLAAELEAHNYDVWMANFRGSKYSRRHQRWNPDVDKQFWDFSFHEMAVVDLPAFMNFILQENNATSLNLIGHSQGNLLFYVLGSTRPEYNEKVNVAIALAPAAFFNIENYQFPLTTVFYLGNTINKWLLSMNQEELFGRNSTLNSFKENVCYQRGVGYDICAIRIISAMGGEDLEELEPEMFYSVIGHYPSTSSRKNGVHLLQLGLRRRFAQFDHGIIKNLLVYKSVQPPAYDLSKVTMKMALYIGKNDKLTPLKNVIILKDRLPNVVEFRVMEREKYNHIDHVWGKHMYKYLFPHIIGLLDKYS